MVAHFGLIPKILDGDAKECDKVVDGEILRTKLSTRCMRGQSVAAEQGNFPVERLNGDVELLLYVSRFWMLPTLYLIYW
jgi:hypothetical protein